LYGLSHHARLTIVEGDMLKIAIPVHPPEKSPLKFSWTPGQHVFIRFLTLGPHALTSHPFSICSLPPQKSGNEKNKLEDAEIVLYVKPIGGLTARLAKLASKFPNILVPIMLDGPYGGLTIKTFAKFDKVIIVAGGSGAGFTLPLIKDILRRQHQEGESASPKTQIHVILSTRNHALKLWYQKEITQLTHLILPSENALGLLTTSIHVTNISTTTTTDHPSIHSTSSTEQIETGKGPTISPSSSTPTSTTEGRPDLHAQITSATSTPGVAVGIAMCGPASMFHDVKNAAAEAQVRVLRGVGAREVYLHSENFG
jgi:NAD(P)H-flavin reductase